MSQISPPIRILLVGSIVLMAAWFAFMRPGGGDEAAPAPAPAASSTNSASAAGQPASPYGSAVESANGAAGAASGTAPAPGTATAPGAAATAPGTTSSATSAAGTSAATVVGAQADAAEAELPAAIERVLDKKVLVLFFYNPKAADDRRVLNSLRRVYLHQGKVSVHKSPISRVSRYAPITRGADVQQSPTVLVVDRHRKVDALVGYVDSGAINQSVVDAILQDGPLVAKDKYLQKLEGFCSDYSDQIRDRKDPRNLKQFKAYVARVSAAGSRFIKRIETAKTPRKWRGLRAQMDSLIASSEALIRTLEADMITGRPSPKLERQARSLVRSADRLDLRLAGYGMEDCR